MDSLPADRLLKFHPDTLVQVRKQIKVEGPRRMAEAVDILDDWIHKQPHFRMKDFDRHFLETTIVCCKGSVERAKSQIDKFCTIRTMIPKFFKVVDVREEFKDLVSSCVTLPKFAPDYNRVMLVKAHPVAHLNQAALVKFYKYNIIMCDYLLAHDYFSGLVMVFDYRDFNLSDLLTKVNTIEAAQASSVLSDGYGVRVKGVHILTSSAIIEKVIAIYKQFLNKKIADRIQVHKSLESLYEFLPKDILPSDYGGKEKSVTDLRKDWFEVLSSDENAQYLKQMNNIGTDEAHRRLDKFNDQYMGMPGTFRTLIVD